ncbi:MAG: DoxX family protein [Verrucomicrobiota bacterium]|nr:DoxX family protein [Verrucomicrobiota bacterium]
MRLAFLAKYREAGLLLIRVSLGLLFLLYLAPTLFGGPKAWAHFGAGAGHFGLHSHFQVWGFLGLLLGCIGAVLMIFGLFFRIGVLLVLLLAIGHAIALYKATGFRVDLPSIEMCFVLAGILFVGPGTYSVDKT